MMVGFPQVFVLVVLVLGTVSCSYYDDLMEGLYQRMLDISPEELDYLDMPNKDLDISSADTRDSEYIEQNAKDGFQYISGGAGEGEQHLTPEGNQSNVKEVKSDDALPFYCHPPNPCPKGFNSRDHGCQDDIHDTVEAQKDWINSMMERGLCACDEEHMFNCPAFPSSINTKSAQEDRDNIDNLIATIFKDQGDNPFSTGNKRESLVAKKSPGMFKRSVGVIAEEMNDPANILPHVELNPYMQGKKIHVVAKKG